MAQINSQLPTPNSQFLTESFAQRSESRAIGPSVRLPPRSAIDSPWELGIGSWELTVENPLGVFGLMKFAAT